MRYLSKIILNILESQRKNNLLIRFFAAVVFRTVLKITGRLVGHRFVDTVYVITVLNIFDL